MKRFKAAVVLNDARNQLHHGCELVMKRLEAELRRRNIRVVATSREGRDWRKDDRFVDALKRSDLILVNGEGTIHHGREAGRDLLKVVEAGSRWGIPCYLINCTYESNPPDYEAYLRGFVGIYVREPWSQHELDQLGIRSAVVPDLTLGAADLPPRERQGVGVTDSTYAALSEMMMRLAASRGWEFLPVLRASRRDGEFSAVEFLRAAKFRMNHVRLRFRGAPPSYLEARNLHVRTSIDGYLQAIAGKRLVVTARFHTLCFCLLTGTPFFALRGNSHKVESMLANIGLEEHRLIDEPDLAGLGDRFDFTDRELQHITSYKATARVHIDAMFDEIAAAVGGDVTSARGRRSGLHPILCV